MTTSNHDVSRLCHYVEFLPLFATFGAESLQEVLDLVELVAFRDFYRRDVRMIQTESLVTRLAVEMAMHFFGTADVAAMADAILACSAAIFGLVNHMMLCENL